MYQHNPLTPYQSFHLPYLPGLKEIKKNYGQDLIKSKSTDLVASVIEKILDGLLKALPNILEKLFGKGLYDLINLNDQYDYQNNYQDIKNVFGNLGLFGHIPMVILKIIDIFTTFMNILKKNKFFRNFLLPASILLIIAGSVVFLIWWLQPNSYGHSGEIYYKVPSDYQPHPYSLNTNGYYDVSYTNDVLYKKASNQQNFNINREKYNRRGYPRTYLNN